MTSISAPYSSIWSSGAQKCHFTRTFGKTRGLGYLGSSIPYRSNCCQSHDLVYSKDCNRYAKRQTVCSSSLKNSDSEEPEDEDLKKESSEPEDQGANRESFRQDLERMIGKDDSRFSGADLATIIRNKYGKSYDVQLIKKEFMGRNLLAMNVMWKYREQLGKKALDEKKVVLKSTRSFPLTEEEYILRLDEVANSLKCWGAVSHIRNSLVKTKERPRIGKAVSIFIDMDDSGARSNEWIYK